MTGGVIMEYYSVPRLKSVKISVLLTCFTRGRSLRRYVSLTQKTKPVEQNRLGRYPLSIDVKASLLCYWQKLEQKSDNPLLNEAFIYARNHSQFYDLLNSDETIQVHYKNEVIKNQQCVKSTRSSIKQQLQKKFSQDWFKAQNDISDSSRQKYTNKEIKKDYRLEEYLKIVRNPAHRISMTKLRLGVHTLRIQTGKYENKGASIPVEERLCLVCKRNCIEDEKHFLIDCTEYESLRQQLYFHISENDATFINLTDHDRTLHLLRLDNDKTSHIIAKYAHLMFKKRKQFQSQKSN